MSEAMAIPHAGAMRRPEFDIGYEMEMTKPHPTTEQPAYVRQHHEIDHSGTAGSLVCR